MRSFGAAPAAASGGGFTFGAPAPAPAAGGFTFGATPAPAPAPGTSIFGAPAPAPGTALKTTFSFGAPAPAPAPTATFGGFGVAKPPTPAPAPGTGLFGAAPAPGATPSFGFGTTPAPAPAAGGGLFGTTLGAPAPAPSAFGTPAPAPGPFGAPAPAPAPFGASAQAPAPGVFGAPAPASGGIFGAPAPSPGVFGAPAPATGIFGAPAPAPAPGFFGGVANQASAGVVTPVAPTPGGTTHYVSPDMRYEDLPEEFRKCIDALATEIKRQRGLADEVSRTNPTHGLQLQAEMRRLRRNLLDLGNEQGTQKLALQELKRDADSTRKQAEVHGTFLVQRLHSHSGLNTVEQLPSDYLRELVESFGRRLGEYTRMINTMKEQLSDEALQGEDSLVGTVAPYGQRSRVTPERLAIVIREQWKTFNQVAGYAAVGHERIDLLRERYKEHFKDDPFEAAERQERAAQRRLEKQMRDNLPQPPAPSSAAAPAPVAVAATAPNPTAAGLGSGFNANIPAPAPGSIFNLPPSGQTSLLGTPAPVQGLVPIGAPNPAQTTAQAPAGGLFLTPATATAMAPGPTAFTFGSVAAPPAGRSVQFGATTTLGAPGNAFTSSFPAGTGSTSSAGSTLGVKKKNKPRNRR